MNKLNLTSKKNDMTANKSLFQSPSNEVGLERKAKIIEKNKLNRVRKLLLVVALANYLSKQPGVFLIVNYEDNNGNICENFPIPAHLLGNLGELKKFLIKNGFPYNLTKSEWDEVKENLNKKPEKCMQLVTNIGFFGNLYLGHDNKIIGEITDSFHPILDPNAKIKPLNLGRSGILEEWQSHIASSALRSSRIMLGICSVLSSLLLHLIGMESGGFHYYGTSSKGKTTCLKCSLSVQGPDGSIESWSITLAGIEEVAAGANNSAVILDELGNLSSDPVKAAQLASNIIYTLSSGKDKRRSVNYTNERLSWRIVIISSGEYSLSAQAVAGGKNRNLGEEVRLIDVPADAGKGMGIFETIPDDTTPSEYAEILNLNCNKFYGVAREIFITKVINSVATKGEDAVKKRINNVMQEFYDAHQIDESNGYQKRIAKRFALSYAAGVFAVHYKILPFSISDVMAGISKCYMDTISNFPKTDGELAQDAFDAIRRELKKSQQFLDIRQVGHGFSVEALENAFGYLATVNDKQVRVIRSSALKSLIPNEKIMNMALDIGIAKGRLLCDADGKKTRQVKSNLKPQSNLPRAYCFLSAPK